MKYKNVQICFKKTLLSVCIASTLASPLAFAESFTVDRLSLFINDGTTSYEDRRLNQEKINLPSNLSSTFSQSKGAHGESIWRWQIKNTGKTTFNNLRLTGLIDLDIDAQNNTFFSVAIVFAIGGSLLGSLIATDVKRYGRILSGLMVLAGIILSVSVADYFFRHCILGFMVVLVFFVALFPQLY